MAEGGEGVPQPKQPVKPEEKKPRVMLNRRQFLQGVSALAGDLALSAVVPVRPPENKPGSTEGKFQLGEYVERDPIPFPKWAVPSFEPLWPYMDEIGKNFGIDPRIIMGYMAMESKGNMFSGSYRGAIGVMQIIPGQSTSEGWHNYLIHEPRYHSIVDNLRKVGIEIADKDYKPYKLDSDETLTNPDGTTIEGINKLRSLFSIVLGAYKIARDQRSYHEFSDAERNFLAHLPDNPYDVQNLPVFEKVSKAQKKIIVYYLGDSNSLYTDSIIGHMAPYNNDTATKSVQPLSTELMNVYKGTLYAAGRENGMDGSFEEIVKSQAAVAMAQNALVKAHPEWRAPLMMIPTIDDMKAKWNKVQTTYNLLDN